MNEKEVKYENRNQLPFGEIRRSGNRTVYCCDQQGKIDYTKWQRQKFDGMSSDEFNEAAVAYSRENPFRGK